MRIAKVRKEQEASMQYQLRHKHTLEEKRELLTKTNPFLHAFGEKLTTPRYQENYADWVNRQYLGDAPHHITSVEEAREYLRKFRQEEANGQAEATTNN